LLLYRSPTSTLFPYTTLFRSSWLSRNKWLHATFFIISSIGCAFFILKELGYIKWILPAIFLTLLYSAPKFPFQPFISLKKFILRSEEHTSELQSRENLVCRLL